MLGILWLMLGTAAGEGLDRFGENDEFITNDEDMFLRVCKSGDRRKITKSCTNHFCFCHNGQWICQFDECSEKIELTESLAVPCCRSGHESGASYKIDSCNWCHCYGLADTDKGRWFCENKDCEGTCATLFYKQCSEGSTLSLDCHHCTCFNEQWKCKFKEECRVNPVEIHHLALDLCDEENKHKLDACDNYCKCKNGQWYCSSKKCDKPHIEQVIIVPECEKGSTKKSSCNTCYCYGTSQSDKGIWFCETKKCNVDTYLRKTNWDTISLQIILETKCETGSRLSLRCHRCVCYAGWRCKQKKKCGMDSNMDQVRDVLQEWKCRVRLRSSSACHRCSKYYADGWKCRLKRECRIESKTDEINGIISNLKCKLALRR